MFWEQVFYLDDGEKFPSTKVKPGYWVSVCKNAGDHLTFNIIDAKMKELVEHSNVQLARLSANPMSNVFTKIHTLEPDNEDTEKDGKPKKEPFPSLDKGDESDSDAGDEASIKSPPIVASVSLPV
jgi:hypothetical protein